MPPAMHAPRKSATLDIVSLPVDVLHLYLRSGAAGVHVITFELLASVVNMKASGDLYVAMH